MSEVIMDTPQKPNAFFQLIKGLSYLLLFIASQFIATYVLTFYYAFQTAANVPEGTEIDAVQIAETALEKALADSNSLLFVYGSFLVIFLLLFFTVRRKNFWEETRFKKFSVKYLPAMALLSFGFYFFVDAVLNFLPKSLLKSYAESSSFINEGSFAFSLVAQALIAPLTEELTFRGLMLSRFDKAFPRWISIAISSLLFGLVHGDPVWFTYAAILGCTFCIVAECTGSVFSTFLMHCVFNASGTVLAYVFPYVTTIELIIFLIIGIPMIVAGFFLLYRTSGKLKAVKE